VTEAASEGEAADSDSRHYATWGGEAKSVGRVIHLSPDAAASDASGALLGVHAHALHLREVYNEAAVADTQAGAVVPAAADGEEQAVLAGEVDRDDHVGNVGAACDQGRASVDHGVVDLAGFVIVRITGLDELPSQARLELLYGCFIVHDGSPFP